MHLYFPYTTSWASTTMIMGTETLWPLPNLAVLLKTEKVL